MPREASLARAAQAPRTPRLSESACIQLAEQKLCYQIKRSHRRRSIALHINEHGLQVLAPFEAGTLAIEQLIQTHAAWILKTLARWREQAPTPLVLEHGSVLPVLGEPCLLRVLAGANRFIWSPDGKTLSLLPRPGAALRKLVEAALRQRLLDYATPRLSAEAAALGVSVPPLALSSARRRWGSCSLHGGIRLNWRLVHLPRAWVDYVIAHELAHTLEMNHSPRFWAVVERLYPNWRATRREMQHAARALPQL